MTPLLDKARVCLSRAGALLVLALPVAASAADNAQIFKCTDASGNVTYQNEPCPKASKSGRIELFDNRWTSTKEEREAEWRRNAGTIELPPRLRLTARYQGQMFEAMRRHHVAMRREYLLFWRALAVLDSTAQRLPADFDLLATMRRFFVEHQPPTAQRLCDAAAAIESPDTFLRIRETRGKLLSLWAQPAPLRLVAEFSSMPAQRSGVSRVAKMLTLGLAGVVAATLALVSQGGSAGIVFGALSLAALLSATRLGDPR